MDETLRKKLELDLQSDVEDIRKDACRIVAQEGDHSVLSILREISSKDTVAVRYFARKAIDAIIKRCGPPVELVELDLDEFLETDEETNRKKLNTDKFLSSLEHPDQAVRFETIKKCAEIVSEIGSQAVLPVLTERLSKSDDPVERSLIIKAIGTFGTKEHISVLIPFFADEDPRVRADTIEALEYIGDPSIYPAIVPLLQDGDNRVRANAAVALKHYGDDHSLQLLEKMLDSEEVWLRDSAAYALREIKSSQTVRLLVNILKREIKYVVYAKAVESLSKVGARSDIPMVKTLLQIEEDKRKRDMLTALVQSLQGQTIDFSRFLPAAEVTESVKALPVGREQVSLALEKVTVGLEHPAAKKTAHSQAEVVVATLDLPALVASLIQDLSNRDEEVRKQAAIKLESLDDARAVPALQKAASDLDNVVRYYAKKALRAMQSKGLGAEQEQKIGLKKLRMLTTPVKYTIGGVVLLFIFVSVVWTVFSLTAPEEKVLQAKTEIKSSFERLIKAYDRHKGVGEKVTWKGIIKKVNPQKRIIVLKSHTYVFSAQVPPGDSVDYVMGDVVEVTGVVKDRSMFGAVKIEAGNIKIVEPNKELRERIKQLLSLKSDHNRRPDMLLRNPGTTPRPDGK